MHHQKLRFPFEIRNLNLSQQPHINLRKECVEHFQPIIFIVLSKYPGKLDWKTAHIKLSVLKMATTISFLAAGKMVVDVDPFTCPISFEIMKDPVICADGITYERREISRWLQKHDTSPKTNLVLANKILIPNYAIKSAIGSRNFAVNKKVSVATQTEYCGTAAAGYNAYGLKRQFAGYVLPIKRQPGTNPFPPFSYDSHWDWDYRGSVHRPLGYDNRNMFDHYKWDRATHSRNDQYDRTDVRHHARYEDTQPKRARSCTDSQSRRFGGNF